MKKDRKKLPYEGELVRKMPKKICFECQHYGCTDFIELQCLGFEKAGKITMFFRKLREGN